MQLKLDLLYQYVGIKAIKATFFFYKGSYIFYVLYEDPFIFKQLDLIHLPFLWNYKAKGHLERPSAYGGLCLPIFKHYRAVNARALKKKGILDVFSIMCSSRPPCQCLQKCKTFNKLGSSNFIHIVDFPLYQSVCVYQI